MEENAKELANFFSSLLLWEAFITNAVLDTIPPSKPITAIPFLGGMSFISFWLFFLASLLGRLPGLIILTFLGAYGVDLTWQQWLLIAAGGVVVVAGGRYVGPKLTARFTST